MKKEKNPENESAKKEKTLFRESPNATNAHTPPTFCLSDGHWHPVHTANSSDAHAPADFILRIRAARPRASPPTYLPHKATLSTKHASSYPMLHKAFHACQTQTAAPSRRSLLVVVFGLLLPSFLLFSLQSLTPSNSSRRIP